MKNSKRILTQYVLAYTLFSILIAVLIWLFSEEGWKWKTLFITFLFMLFISIGAFIIKLFSTLFLLRKIGIYWKDFDWKYLNERQEELFTTSLTLREIVDTMHQDSYFDGAFYKFSTQGAINQVEVYEKQHGAFYGTRMVLIATPQANGTYQLQVTSDTDRAYDILVENIFQNASFKNIRNIKQVEKILKQQ